MNKKKPTSYCLSILKTIKTRRVNYCYRREANVTSLNNIKDNAQVTKGRVLEKSWKKACGDIAYKMGIQGVLAIVYETKNL